MFNYLVSLLWERRLRKLQAKNDKIYAELGELEITKELAEKDPEFRENLRKLGVKMPPRDGDAKR